MTRKFVTSLFALAIGTVASVALAADNQSLHFYVPATSAVNPSDGDDLRANLKARGLDAIQTDAIDLFENDQPEIVAIRVAKALCKRSFSQFGNLCKITTPAECIGLVSCCDSAYGDPLDPNKDVIFACTNTILGYIGFRVGRTTFDPMKVGAAAVPLGVGNVSNMNCENKNRYNDIGNDIAGRTLIQVRPNTITGTIQIKVYQTQGNPNPRIANVTVDSTRNDPGESLALHTAIETALEGLSLNPAIVATTHPNSDAIRPLTAVPATLQQAGHFVEITNNRTVGITEVEVVVVPGQGLTLEGTENAAELPVPALSTWGMLILIVMLLSCGYWLMRRRCAGTATA